MDKAYQIRFPYPQYGAGHNAYDVMVLDQDYKEIPLYHEERLTAGLRQEIRHMTDPNYEKGPIKVFAGDREWESLGTMIFRTHEMAMAWLKARRLRRDAAIPERVEVSSFEEFLTEALKTEDYVFFQDDDVACLSLGWLLPISNKYITLPMSKVNEEASKMDDDKRSLLEAALQCEEGRKAFTKCLEQEVAKQRETRVIKALETEEGRIALAQVISDQISGKRQGPLPQNMVDPIGGLKDA
jgi:hypothetical protein